MNKQFWVMAICAAVGAVIGVVIVDWIAPPADWIKYLAIGIGAGIGVLVGMRLAQK